MSKIEAALRSEFDRQVETLLQKRYPRAAGVETKEFMRHVEPLRKRLGQLARRVNGACEGRIPFVIVVKRDLVAEEKAMPRVALKEKKGFSIFETGDLDRFTAIEGVKIPGGLAYLLVDIDTGKETLNVTPDDAMTIIKKARRSPLTIAEGIALVTHYPEVLKKNNCFSLPGSRCGDRRVTALWISQGRPKLGWCWAGNPHTWLGSASCRGRVGADRVRA
jgi:hypothetical protein